MLELGATQPSESSPVLPMGQVTTKVAVLKSLASILMEMLLISDD